MPHHRQFENNFYFADPEIFRILSFTFLKGQATTALANPTQIVINRRIAEKYFGSVDRALGKQIEFEGSIPLEISGIFENFPAQSSFEIELISHFENYFTIEPEAVRSFLKQDWMYNPVTSLILIRRTG
ncbi:MAG: ABC transporter permease [Cyclobacteriaceae bacterium]